MSALGSRQAGAYAPLDAPTPQSDPEHHESAQNHEPGPPRPLSSGWGFGRSRSNPGNEPVTAAGNPLDITRLVPGIVQRHPQTPDCRVEARFDTLAAESRRQLLFKFFPA